MFHGFSSNISKGIKIDFSTLSKKDKKDLIKFIARLSELSYRRGFEQCDSIKDDINLDSLRPLISSKDSNLEYDEIADKIAIDVLTSEYTNNFKEIGLIL